MCMFAYCTWLFIPGDLPDAWTLRRVAGAVTDMGEKLVSRAPRLDILLRLVSKVSKISVAQ